MIKHPKLESREDSNKIFYEKLSYIPKIIKAKLICRYFHNILIDSFELKKSVDWPKILLAIIMMFESLQCSIKCLFPLIEKVVATIYILLSQSIHKDSILYSKVVKIIINTSGFV